MTVQFCRKSPMISYLLVTDFSQRVVPQIKFRFIVNHEQVVQIRVVLKNT